MTTSVASYEAISADICSHLPCAVTSDTLVPNASHSSTPVKNISEWEKYVRGRASLLRYIFQPSILYICSNDPGGNTSSLLPFSTRSRMYFTPILFCRRDLLRSDEKTASDRVRPSNAESNFPSSVACISSPKYDGYNGSYP